MKNTIHVLASFTIVAILTLLLSPDNAIASPGGFSGRTQKTSSSGCGSCHGSSRTLTVNVLVAGPDTVAAGQTRQFSMTISGGPAVGSGGDIAVRNGTLAAVSSFLKVSNGEIVQRNDVAMTGGSITYQFNYTAPATAGTDTMYGTGLSTNATGGTSGDQWNWAPKKPIVVILPNPAPPAPALSAPSNHATSQPATTTLRWHSAAGTTTYRLQMSTDPLFVTTTIDDSTLTDTVTTTPLLANGTTFYWRVRGKGTGGSGTYSTVWDFTTIIAAPVAPSLIAPADGAVSQSLSPSLTWTSTPTAAAYRVQVSPDPLFGSTVLDDSTIPTATYQATSLLPATQYFWRVNAKNIGGSSSWSPIFDFTTMNGSGFSTSATARWNVLSIPVTVEDSSIGSLFPTAISPASTFENSGYSPKSVLSTGVGYWIKFSAAQTVSFIGTLRNSDTVEVKSGWNLIGTLSASVPVNSVIQVPPGNIDSRYYGYETNYIPADVLLAGRGYWVKVLQDGILILQAP